MLARELVVTGRVSMSDVASSAGVSQKTVSRVVNGEPHVSDTLRERVLREIARLGYRPNESARALVTRRSRRVGIIATGTSYFGPAAVLRGLERAARRAGYYVSVVHADEQDEDEARHTVTHLVSQGIDGVVVATWLGSTSPADHVPPGIPVLAIGYSPDGGGTIGSVGNDETAGARAATEYLLRLGHRTVHHVAGAPGWDVTERRAEGWRAALRAAGAPVPSPVHGDWSPASGHRATTELLRTAATAHTSGFPPPSGTSGVPPTTGVSGASGVPPTTGASGTAGVSGASGTSGTTDDADTSCVSGPSEAIGVSGVPGASRGGQAPGKGLAPGKGSGTGPVTALFVANDQMAIGAVHALTRAGLRVPEDVSVVGYDDVPEAAYLSVPLTTVRQDFDAIAEQGMRWLIAAITGAPPPADAGHVPVELVIRDSATPPREGSAREGEI